MASTTHTTNYINTFIEVADDSPVHKAEVPPQKGEVRTIANLQYERISRKPYGSTSDEILFGIHCERKGISGSEIERAAWFSKGQACMRASPLPKRFGWGIHHDGKGRMALVPKGSVAYDNFLKDDQVKKVKAMRSKRI